MEGKNCGANSFECKFGEENRGTNSTESKFS